MYCFILLSFCNSCDSFKIALQFTCREFLHAKCCKNSWKGNSANMQFYVKMTSQKLHTLAHLLSFFNSSYTFSMHDFANSHVKELHAKNQPMKTLIGNFVCKMAGYNIIWYSLKFDKFLDNHWPRIYNSRQTIIFVQVLGIKSVLRGR